MTLQLTRPKPPPALTPKPEPPVGKPESRRRRHWAWLAACFPFAFAVPFLLTDVLDLNRDLFYGLYALAVAGFVAAWARDTRLTRSDFTRNWRWGLALGAAGAAVMALIVPHRRRDRSSREHRARRRRPLARRSIRRDRRRSAVRVPDPRRLRGVRRNQAPRPGGRHGADRDDRDDRLARDHGRVPPRVLGLPVGEAAQANRGRHDLERAHAADAEPARSADRACRPPRQRGPAATRPTRSCPRTGRNRPRRIRSFHGRRIAVAADATGPRMREPATWTTTFLGVQMAVDVATRPRPAPPAALTLREQIVEARSVLKTYDTGKVEVHALRGVDLGVAPGRDGRDHGAERLRQDDAAQLPVRASTRSTTGDVLIEGVSLADMSDRERTDYRARQMGFVFQFYNLMPVLSAVENVELPLLVAARLDEGGAAQRARGARAGRPRATGRARAGRAFRRPAPARDDRPRAGQQPGDRLGRRAHGRPRQRERRRDHRADAAAEREHELTFLIVTHDIGVGRKTDRIVRMLDGQIVSEENLEVRPMIARASLAEIDTVRMSVDEAVELFRESVLPALHEQPGYEGVYVLSRPKDRRSC